MLSTKYHLAYWVIALTTAGIYRLLLLVPGAILAQRIAFLPMAVYAAYNSSEWHRSPTKKTTRQLYIHQAILAHLLVALGSVVDYYHIPNDLPKPTVLIHVLLAFTVAGNLECLRQNRKDIEPLPGVLYGYLPRNDLRRFDRWLKSMAECLFIVAPLCFTILYLLVKVTDEALSRIWGMSLTYIVPFWHLPPTGPHVKGRMGSAMVSMILASPFLDIAETLYYVIARKVVPGRRGWVPEAQALREGGMFHPLLDLDVTSGIIVWPICLWMSRNN